MKALPIFLLMLGPILLLMLGLYFFGYDQAVTAGRPPEPPGTVILIEKFNIDYWREGCVLQDARTERRYLVIYSKHSSSPVAVCLMAENEPPMSKDRY